MPLEDQFKFHQEALRRATSTGTAPRGESLEGTARVAGLQIGDMWSSAGQMPGMMTPDGQGPTTALTFGDVAKTGPTTANFEDIVRDVHHPKR